MSTPVSVGAISPLTYSHIAEELGVGKTIHHHGVRITPQCCDCCDCYQCKQNVLIHPG